MMSVTTKVLVMYYSRTGNTEQMAASVAKGARDQGADVRIQAASELCSEDFLGPDVLIVGTPTYYGLMSAELKQLFDESVAQHGDLAGKVGGAFASAANIGGGNETAVLSILQTMLIHGMVVQGAAEGDHYGPISIGAPDNRAMNQCRELGARLVRLAERLD